MVRPKSQVNVSDERISVQRISDERISDDSDLGHWLDDLLSLKPDA
jgi:hypothetical protein